MLLFKKLKKISKLPIDGFDFISSLLVSQYCSSKFLLSYLLKKNKSNISEHSRSIQLELINKLSIEKNFFFEIEAAYRFILWLLIKKFLITILL